MDGEIINHSNARHSWAREKIKRDIGVFKIEDLAASIQKHLEENMVQYVDYWVKKTGLPDLVTAGGVFANVKLNQKIVESPSIESFFVHPHMGDGGIALGAALFALAEFKLGQGGILKPKKLRNVYFGPEFSNEEIQKAIISNGLHAKDCDDVSNEIANKIDNGRIVGLFQGRMEFGPRALGNRSILAKPVDKSINNSLNRRLARTEFMPFAPSVLEEEAMDYFIGYEKAKYPSKFMTITFDVPKEKQPKIEAVVHIDGTARPQAVDKYSNESYYQILKAYKDVSGLPLFINTSFNAHEEPIVCSPQDAINAFKAKRIDCLVIGNFVLE